MATTADAFPIVREKSHEPANNIAKARPQDISKAGHLSGEQMGPPRRHADSEDFDQREALHILTLASTSLCKAMEAQTSRPVENGNGATNKRVTWLMAIFAMVTLMGAGANFLTSSGVAIGGKQQEIQQAQKDLQRVQTDLDKMEQRYEKSETKLREFEVWLQTTREKLADKGWKLPPLPKGQE